MTDMKEANSRGCVSRAATRGEVVLASRLGNAHRGCRAALAESGRLSNNFLKMLDNKHLKFQ
jgi:hypothetical protein